MGKKIILTKKKTPAPRPIKKYNSTRIAKK